jgi:2-polyprenyl-6-methoxyphenol hydroxylase-like FAD-dependent oxidoreductase
MILKKLCTALAIGSFALGATASVASAGPPAGAGGGGKPAGIACQQAGISTLQSLGLLPAVAAGGIEVVGVGQVAFKDVLSLHRTNPELFQTGGVSVVVPGIGTVPATWCD